MDVREPFTSLGHVDRWLFKSNLKEGCKKLNSDFSGSEEGVWTELRTTTRQGGLQQKHFEE